MRNALHELSMEPLETVTLEIVTPRSNNQGNRVLYILLFVSFSYNDVYPFLVTTRLCTISLLDFKIY